MNYHIVCDTRIPDMAFINTHKGVHSSWAITPAQLLSIISDVNGGPANLKTVPIHEIINNPEAAADMLLYSADSLEEITAFLETFTWDKYPELFI